VCVWRGERYRLEDSASGPFAAREDREIVARELAALMAMPSAGDLVVYGIDALGGHVSFLDEIGAHAGPSPEELHTFVVAPVAAPLPDRIDHPTELYRILVGYQSSCRNRRRPRRRRRRHRVAVAT
jgi:hypothetical protein